MMETAKVDIRKLQQLNDRINQTIDALNQVRLSVHGLSHTSPVNPIGQQGGLGIGGQQQAGFPMQQAGFPVQQAGFQQPFVPGLSHSPMQFGGQQGGLNPYAGFAGGAQLGWNPYAAFAGVPQAGFHTLAGAGFAGLQGGPIPYMGQFGGLSHTGQEPLEAYSRAVWSDPLLATRIAQTFPYAQYPVPPVVSLY
jgi:hypothetical protein